MVNTLEGTGSIFHFKTVSIFLFHSSGVGVRTMMVSSKSSLKLP